VSGKDQRGFSRWDGACDMGAFEATPLHALSVTLEGSGSGSVSSDPGTIDCPDACTDQIGKNTVVTLTATPDAGSSFAGWSGDTDCDDGSVTMDADKICTAIFTLASTDCEYSISPLSRSFPASAGSDTVSVEAPGNCAWTAKSNVTWITINSGNSGTGNGTVAYSVLANPAATQRKGTMTIAGKTFTVTQDGKPIISARPMSVNFGPVRVGDTWERIVTVKNTGASYLSITSVDITGANADNFDRDAEGCSKIPPLGTCDIKVTFAPQTPFGKKSAVMGISSNDARKPVVNVKLLGQAAPPRISASPMSVNFGAVPVDGSSPEKIVTIKNNGVSDLIIGKIDIAEGLNPSEFSQTSDCLSTPIPAQGSCVISVKFSPVMPYGKKTALMSIESNDPKKPVIKVTLTGQAPPPRISVIPTSIGFGSVSVGSTSSRVVTVMNAGVSALSVGPMEITGTNPSEFSQTNDCSTLPQGGTCSITVLFAPESAGAKSASLTIHSNDPLKPLGVIVKLAGTGTGT